MRIQFLQDYKGRETAMIEYLRGDVVLFSFIQGKELIRLGVAVEYKPAKKEKVKDGKNS